MPKIAKTSTLNDYRPVALTSVVMKVLERWVLKHLKSSTNDVLDPLQFAYRRKRSVDDAVSLAFHYALPHLECPNTYARVLYVDYSWAFNSVVPEKLFHKLQSLSVERSLCYWILDIFLRRPQVVRTGDTMSDTIVLSRGSPQGCYPSRLCSISSIQMTAYHTIT